PRLGDRVPPSGAWICTRRASETFQFPRGTRASGERVQSSGIALRLRAGTHSSQTDPKEGRRPGRRHALPGVSESHFRLGAWRRVKSGLTALNRRALTVLSDPTAESEGFLTSH